MNWTGAYDSRFLVGDWTGLLEEHDRWVHDYNVQDPAYGTAQAHRERLPADQRTIFPTIYPNRS
jgi:hypothetical protein